MPRFCVFLMEKWRQKDIQTRSKTLFGTTNTISAHLNHRFYFEKRRLLHYMSQNAAAIISPFCSTSAIQAISLLFDLPIVIVLFIILTSNALPLSHLEKLMQPFQLQNSNSIPLSLVCVCGCVCVCWLM